MSAWLWSGSQFEPCDAIPVSDRGFRYGMSVFETVRLWRGQPVFLEGHWRRLVAACADRGFPFPATALGATSTLLAEKPDGVARLYLTAGDGTLLTQEVTAPRFFVLAEEREEPSRAPCTVGICVDPHRAPFGGLKTGNYWANVDTLHRALAHGYDEALLFNEHSELISATTANVFILAGGEVITPALHCGARDGVTREWAMKQLRVREGSLFHQDLLGADEVFLTSSWHGVRAVAQVDGRTLASTLAGERLARAFAAEIGA